MKTTISLLLAIVFVLASPMSVFATAENNTSQLAPMVGILTLDDGTQVEIIGKLCSINTRTTTSNDTCLSITYQYDIPRPASNARAGGESTIWDHDGGVASNVYLTLHYLTRNSPAEYLLTAVSGYWDVHDPKASVESAYLTYGCSGLFPLPVSQHAYDIPVNNNFYVATSFTNYIANIDWSVLGAYLKVNYLMGTARRWDFTLKNYLIDNGGTLFP